MSSIPRLQTPPNSNTQSDPTNVKITHQTLRRKCNMLLPPGSPAPLRRPPPTHGPPRSHSHRSKLLAHHKRLHPLRRQTRPPPHPHGRGGSNGLFLPRHLNRRRRRSRRAGQSCPRNCGYGLHLAILQLVRLGLGLGAPDHPPSESALSADRPLQVPWLYPAEINSLKFRTKGAALATAGDWLFNYGKH